ncbi:DUF1611 domain-containing protein [bacterium]|nr:DUF1611 domain-containing protein [bacterium]
MQVPSTVILAEDALGDDGMSKTAYGLLRYAPESVLAVIDSRNAGRDCAEVTGIGKGIPVVPSLIACLDLNPKRLVIGVATAGGVLPNGWRGQIKTALENGMEVVSGMHGLLAEDPELALLAGRCGGRITDLRKSPDDLPVAFCKAQNVTAGVVLTVGTDCNAGKMTASLEMLREAERRGIRSAFCATGQTGIAIAGRGIAVDHTVSDFTAGAAEKLVLDEGADESVRLIFVEGQGALCQPSYSGVTLALLHGSCPDAMVLCHRATQARVMHVEWRMPPLTEHIALYDAAMRLVKPGCRVKAVALNTRGLEEQPARRMIEAAERQTGLPATDPVRFGAGPLLDALLVNGLLPKQPLYAGPES